MGVHSGGFGAGGGAGFAQGLFKAGFQLVKELVHALLQALVFKHQCIAGHHPRHARVFFGELEHQGDYFAQAHSMVGFALDDLVDQREDRLLDELDQAFKHLRLAGKVTVQRRLAHVQARGQCRGGDAFRAGLLEHAGQGLQNLNAPLAGLGPLAGCCVWQCRFSHGAPCAEDEKNI